MSTTATLTVDDLPELGRDGRRVVVDCKHGTTRVWSANAPPPGLQLSGEDSARMALLKHYAEERCRCIRKLWRRYFDCELGEIALARAGGNP